MSAPASRAPGRLLRQLGLGLRALVLRARRDRDVADEVAQFFAAAEEDAMARGLSAEEARRAVRRELGNPAAAREEARAYGWENLVEATLADLRVAARRLRASPGFALLAVGTLGLGLGATTAVWSVVQPVLFAPLPYPDGERLALLWEVGEDGSRVHGTYGAYRELGARAHAFEGLAVMRSWQPTLTGPGEPERLEGQRVSAEYFRVLGVRPALGRGFTAADDRPEAPRVAVLSDALWRRRFGADPRIVGRSVPLDDRPTTIVGVLPAGFANVLAPDTGLWSPLRYDLTLPQAWGHHLRTLVRVRPHVAFDQARRELASLSRALVAEHPAQVNHGGFLLEGLREGMTRDARPVLHAVLGASLLVLLLAAVNVGDLLLGRGLARRGELALRLALGASRSRIVRQLVAESLLLAGLAGAAGMAIAWSGTRALVPLAPPGLLQAGAAAVDGRAFGLGWAVAALAGLLCGLVPAFAATRGDRARTDLAQASRRTAGSGGRARRLLVVAEVGAALVLVACSGLLVRTLGRLLAEPPGFDPAGVLSLQIQTVGRRFDDDAARHRFFAEALAAVRRVPGVEAAAYTSQLPLSGDDEVYGVHFAASSGGDPSADQGAYRYAVSPEYRAAMRIPLLRGRDLEARDDAGAPRAALLSASYARRRFPEGDALGQRLHVGPEDGPWYTVVGIVGDVRQRSLAAAPADAVYLPTTQWLAADPVLSLVVRTRGDAARLAAAVRAAVWSVDKDQPVVRVATLDQLVARSAAARRFALLLFEAFAGVALVLAAVGIYGVLGNEVAARRREIGVRVALGASRGEVLRWVVRQGLALGAAGAAAGIAGALAATRGLSSLLYGVSALDPATYAATLVVVLAMAAGAALGPAWRAARIDPAQTLRAE